MNKKKETKKSKKSKKLKLQNFRKKDVPKLNYGIVHSQVGFSDGVSIVMSQIEKIMINNLGISKSNIYYLVGKAKTPGPYIRQKRVFWHKTKTNRTVQRHFEEGFGGALSEKIEAKIKIAKQEIKKFIDDKKIDVLIIHNSSHPVNFISSIAVSRYYRDQINKGKKTPKYILWWHDSHLERERFAKPAMDVKKYLLEGVPGRYVEYIVFINKQQFHNAQEYFKELDERSPGLYDTLFHNHAVIYNTATAFINTVDDLKSVKYRERVDKFLEDFKINELLTINKLKLDDVQFCLQHTRIVPRKRIDFALEWTYELFSKLKEKKLYKGFIFFISGHHGDEFSDYKKELIKLNKELSKKYNTKRFFLVFAEDCPKANISFEEIPVIIRKLGGIGTYFSEIEGFGNNLLEMLAAGIIPAVYTYPVFITDIAKYKFKIVLLDKFEVTPESIKEMVNVIKSKRIKMTWANKNLEILRKKLSHEIIAPKLTRAIIRKRNIPKTLPPPKSYLKSIKSS
ncbi:hypothetical protein GF386_02865 [Candidatus Pacearchaeota archaeon]|nr:hypothetical protein [Candidatus Pacearchaeota archaeon]MBD3283088.1 hypothetical protein [Candidatus Pacearchaeota archaeon]